MERLGDMKAGSVCRVIWMVGSDAEYLRKHYALTEDEIVYVNSNSGSGGMIISYGSHRIGISHETAGYVKVSSMTA